jgi:hypothetical protein
MESRENKSWQLKTSNKNSPLGISFVRKTAENGGASIFATEPTTTVYESTG